jgi:Putative rhamnosyl transferase
MSSFQHFILTRFNVPLQFDLPPGEQPVHMGIDEKWLTRRFDLFERVCLASVARQTELNFRWLIFMDWATPVAFKERMAALTVRYGFLQPIYCSQFDAALVLEEIHRLESPDSIRLTTRLDNDDAIHPRLIERVQARAREQLGSRDPARGFYISFPIGCSEQHADFYIQRYRFNPFTSFVSSQESETHVLSSDHRYIADVAPVIFEYCRPLWCQVIHGENVANELRGVYWPWGGSSEFAPGITNGFRRSPLWQTAEVVRSAFRYLFFRK